MDKIMESLTNCRGLVCKFRDEYAFLSNFYNKDVTINDFEGNKFTSSEAMFQSYKTTDPKERAKFAKMSPKEAKAAGRKVKLRSDWEEIKFDVMWYVVFQKFQQNQFLRKNLIETAGMRLVEGNSWNDKYWGAVPKELAVGDTNTTVFDGENRLGLILMQIRRILLDSCVPVFRRKPSYKVDEFDPYPRENITPTRSILDIVDRRPFEEYYKLKMSVINMLTTQKPGLIVDKVVSE